MRIGIDIGGTFTDIVAFDSRSGRLETLKLSSTPQQPGQAVIKGLETLLARCGRRPDEITQLVHGTTVATNAVLEGKWAPTALLTTEGFRDVLEIGRQNRPELYNFFTQRPRPMVPRHLRYEVPERLDFQGRVVRPLHEPAVREVAQHLRNQRVESVAVVLLFSYLNSAHEQWVRQVLQDYLQLPIILSSETLPQFREYERSSTTVMNAALVPVLDGYLRDLEEQSRRLGIEREWRVMQSNGGITNPRLARKLPVTLLLSGPAGGVEGARFIGELTGYRNLITLDMGGTSCDLSLIRDGRARLTSEGQIAGRPLGVPLIDIQTIGAGGGSIAWIDSGGALRVGPQSAAARPGPACYGRGGMEPTVTDAQLVLGRLNAQSPLGDIPTLDVEAARRAICQRVADPLGMSLEEAAAGIIAVANANMERAIRVISVERGHDPREFTLVAFGGAGPLHAGELAQHLEMRKVIIPRAAGVLAALGLLAADLAHHFVQTVLQGGHAIDWPRVNQVYRDFKAEGRSRLRDDGLTDEQISFSPSMDVRYRGQSYELNVAVPDRTLEPSDLAEIAARLHDEHRRAYGYAAPEEPLEIVNLRLMAVGRWTRPQLSRLDPTSKAGALAPSGERGVHFRSTGWLSCAVYSWDDLGASVALRGPAIIEGRESTVAICPGQRARTDAYGNLLLEVSDEAA